VPSSAHARSFDLTVSSGGLKKLLPRTKGLGRFCPLVKSTAFAGPRVERNLAIIRKKMEGSYCVDKRPLLRYSLAGFDYDAWLRSRAALRDLYFASPGPKSTSIPGVAHYEKGSIAMLKGGLKERERRGELAVCVHGTTLLFKCS